MLKNYFTIAIRNLWRNKTYAFINIVGLAVGMAAVFVIARFVFEEISYDQFARADRIYRVVRVRDESSFTTTQPILASTLINGIPEIEQVARLDQPSQDRDVIRIDNQLQQVEPFYFADPEILDIFPISLSHGDPRTALNDPRSVIVSRQFADIYLADGNPLDQILTIQYGGTFYDMRVTGVLDNIPKNSLFNPDVLLPATLVEESPPLAYSTNYYGWMSNFWTTLILLRDGVTASGVEAKIQNTLESILPEMIAPMSKEYTLQPLPDVHLRSKAIRSQVGMYGDINRVRLYALLGLGILIIAGINFINLNMAQASRRLKEMGIRKVVGSGRGAIASQLVWESLLVTIISLPIAVTLFEFMLPFANRMLSREMEISLTGNFTFTLFMILVALLVGVFCGGITALYLSTVRPVAHLTHQSTTLSGSLRARQAMIAFQFIAFSGLLVASLVFRSQMDYLRNAQLGYNKEQVVVMNLPDSDTEGQYNALKATLLEDPSIEGVTMTSSVPPKFGIWITFGDASADMEVIYADADYLQTLDIPLLAGRNLRQGEERAYVLNETAFRTYFPGETFREGLTIRSGIINVVGLMQDVHVHSFYGAITPLALANGDNYLSCVAVRIAAGHIPEGIAAIQNAWQSIYPDYLFTYEFVDDAFTRMYESDRILGYLVQFFTALAIVVACMGLFGLVTFAATRRTKEIGIRKVVGASVAQVVTLLSKEFLVLVAIANVIAWPIAWYAMHRWLENFAYRVELSWWLFVLAGLLALVIALATVSWQTIRAATANPVKALRYE